MRFSSQVTSRARFSLCSFPLHQPLRVGKAVSGTSAAQLRMFRAFSRHWGSHRDRRRAWSASWAPGHHISVAHPIVLREKKRGGRWKMVFRLRLRRISYSWDETATVCTCASGTLIRSGSCVSRHWRSVARLRNCLLGWRSHHLVDYTALLL